MKGMTVIVKTIASWVKVLIFLFGIYIILFGHLTPGGGFAGGVIIASSYVLLMLAFGRGFVEQNLSLPLASKLDCVGAFLFALIAVLGLVYGGSFFINFL
jgi:multisubunit Na+/H+ antiporter MnhB subunit